MSLLIVTFILIAALFATRISDKIGISSLLMFIFLGIFLKFFISDFNDYDFVFRVSQISLMVIMFYGGFSTNWSMVKGVVKESFTLSTLGVILTAMLTGFFTYKFLGIDIYEGMLLGSVIASTDYASVSSILVSKNLNFKYSTAPILELESGSNDPIAYTLTIVFISLLLGEKIFIPGLILKQMGLGIIVGILFGVLVKKLISIIHYDEDGLFTVFIAASMLGTYSIAELIGANSYLAVYLYGIYLGNQEFSRKRDIIFFYDGIGSLVQISLFFLLGFLADYRSLIAALPYGFIIMIFISLIARPLVVYFLMTPFKLKKNQMHIISMAGFRGAAAIAFAIMVINSNIKLSIDLFHIVFVICLLSSLIQGFLLPIFSKKLNMIDYNDTVLNTFNYYQDKSDIGFIKTRIQRDSIFVGKPLNEFKLMFDVIVAKIIRKGNTVVPKGSTLIKEGDIIIIAGEMYFDKKGEELKEFTISKKHRWVGQSIKNIDLSNKKLIVMIQKADSLVVPNGDTVLEEGDKIILLEKLNNKD
ncbi:MAG: potassium/proton antiporter [Peptoniphilaceae bacterium]